MVRKKDIIKDKKWLVHSLNVQEYKDYTTLIKGWIEAKKYAKGKLLHDIKKGEQENKKIRNINMFFVIYNTFIPLLKTFKNSKAINLYVYCGLTMDYESGYLKEDLKEISNFFKCTERAVYKWIRELENAGALFTKKHMGEKYIFIKPYGVKCEDNYTNKDSFEELIIKYKKWIKMNKESQTSFFAIHINFKQYIYTLSGGAVKLYIYCGLYTDKSTKKIETAGTFFQSLKMISENLSRETGDKKEAPSLKTVCGWFKELKQTHLVEKYQRQLNIASTIYVKPLVRIRDLEKYKWVTQLENFKYIGNVDTKVLHHKDCIKATYISKVNKKYFNDIEIAVKQNFKRCNVCKCQPKCPF